MIHEQKGIAAAKAYRESPDDLVRRFMPLVRRIAWHVHGSANQVLEIDDLIQIGMVALAECARRHDQSCENGFAAYAKLRVRGAMIDTLRAQAGTARGATARRRRMQEAASRIEGEKGRAPSQAELAAALEIDVNELAAWQAAGVPMRFEPMDDAYSDSNPAFADSDPDAFTLMCNEEMRGRLVAAIASLPERQQLVIQLYHVEELNLAEIAAVLDVSVPRVHQIKAAAHAALRKMLTDPE